MLDVSFDRAALLAALKAVGGALPKQKNLKPVLQSALLTATDLAATLEATDMELGIRVAVSGATVKAPGQVLLPHARLLAILSAAGDETMTLTEQESGILVQGMSCEYELPAEAVADFPSVPTAPEDNPGIVLDAGVLAELVKHSTFAAADSESARYNMKGVSWQQTGDKLLAVATDGRRLAVAEAELPPGLKDWGKPSLPVRVLDLAAKVAEAGPVRCVLLPNEVFFVGPTASVYGRLIEGRFPAWQEIFPKKTAAEVPVSVGALLRATRQAAVMTDDADSRRVVYRFESGKLTLSAEKANRGRAKITVPLEWTGGPVEIALDPVYLREMLEVLDPEAVVVVCLGATPSAPVLLRTGARFDYVLMPLT